MKIKTFLASVTVVATTIMMALPAPAAAKYTAGSYAVDNAHSKVGFEIPHLVISTVEGTFSKFEGRIDLADKFDKSKVSMTVDTSTINTGNTKRDDHLRSGDFFDVGQEKNKTMKFESTGITGTPDSFKLKGKLTIKGVTKDATFDGKYLGSVNDGNGNEKAAFTAKTKINRKDFGLTWGKAVEAGPVVGDEVTIDLKLQAGRPVAKK